MPAGSFIAALVAFFALIAGSVIVSGFRGEEFSMVSDLLFRRAEGATLMQTALAWGWLVLGLLGVAGAFAAFASEEGDYDRVQHRRIPLALPLAFLAGSFGLLWLMLAPAPTLVALAPPVEAAPQADIEVELVGGDAGLAPIAAPAEVAAPQPAAPLPAALEPVAPAAPIIDIAPIMPLASSEETPLYWTYEYPLVKNGIVVSSREVDLALARFMPMEDEDGAVARMLCGKAWVAFSGSASEEGPEDRNAMRARARAELVAARAEAWLDGHPECDRPLVLALDLGQHQPTSAGGPTATAYQRQVIVIGRKRARPGEPLAAAAAIEEMRLFYANEAMRARLLGARHYRADAAVFLPGRM